MTVYVIYVKSNQFVHWTATDLTLNKELAKRAVNRWEAKGLMAFFEMVMIDEELTSLLY